MGSRDDVGEKTVARAREKGEAYLQGVGLFVDDNPASNFPQVPGSKVIHGHIARCEGTEMAGGVSV